MTAAARPKYLPRDPSFSLSEYEPAAGDLPAPVLATNSETTVGDSKASVPKFKKLSEAFSTPKNSLFTALAAAGTLLKLDSKAVALEDWMAPLAEVASKLGPFVASMFQVSMQHIQKALTAFNSAIAGKQQNPANTLNQEALQLMVASHQPPSASYAGAGGL